MTNRTKVIIGAHGLANKPPRDVLAAWWRDAIVEGLANVGASGRGFVFSMIHWADLLYSVPLHDNADLDFDSLYNRQPYYRADPENLKTYRDSWRDRLRAGVRDAAGSAFDMLRERTDFDGLANLFMRKVVRDLSYYYDPNRKILDRKGERDAARTVLLDEIKTTLRDVAPVASDVMVIGHSMGSILAYEALRDLGREDGNQVRVSHLVTIGSPLGLPTVKARIAQRPARDGWADDPGVRTPTIVTKSWKNFADRDDKVAADLHLRDDYEANQTGIRVEDDLVANDYTNPPDHTEANPHKSYGYLRCPEVASHVAEFLAA